MTKTTVDDQHPATEHVNIITDMDDDLVAMAHQAAEREKAMPFRQALKLFWPGAIWSMCLSLALVMEGYDVGLVRLPGSQQLVRCKTDGPAESVLWTPGVAREIWRAEPKWHWAVRVGELASCTQQLRQRGTSLGSSCEVSSGRHHIKAHDQINGWASYRFGYKKTYLVAMASMIATIFILVFAQSIEMLMAGGILCGIPWGGRSCFKKHVRS